MLAAFDPWILAFSLVTVAVTIWMGFRSAKTSKSASDFFVAGRSVSVGWNASAISGEYLSAASFMGVAGMVMSSGYDALWYPVCYACGYLFLLLFIAGPLRRFGAYTIPDFAEGRYDSPVFRKIAVIFVLFIGFFYTMPQMKGAGTTLAYIFPGLPYWVGVVLVGAVITLNVALGGMKGITLVQAFQYWAKMFAISVPIFVLMSVYGSYGKQVGANLPQPASNTAAREHFSPVTWKVTALNGNSNELFLKLNDAKSAVSRLRGQPPSAFGDLDAFTVLRLLAENHGLDRMLLAPSAPNLGRLTNKISITTASTLANWERDARAGLRSNGVEVIIASSALVMVPVAKAADYEASYQREGMAAFEPNAGRRLDLPAKAPKDETWLNPFGPLTTRAAKAAKPTIHYSGPLVWTNWPTGDGKEPELAAWMMIKLKDSGLFWREHDAAPNDAVSSWAQSSLLADKLSTATTFRVGIAPTIPSNQIHFAAVTNLSFADASAAIQKQLALSGITVLRESGTTFTAFPTKDAVITPVDPKPYALLYTYSLIIALVCGTAGLPHILVRFYTNPDGVAAKRTTMWVMILIGIFYVFPPVFGVMGRNLMPSLYEGTGAKGTDKVVLELPRILNESKVGAGESGKVGGSTNAASLSPAPSPTFPPAAGQPQAGSTGIPWGSILSGITCAGAFAAFMSTFSGLLVSMTGALAHDVYGRMLRPNSTPADRMRMFKFCAVAVGTVAVVLGSFVEPLQINFMVGQAFAIAAASYFPLLFMSVWWRGMTMRGAAAGMLTGGVCALAAVTLTNFSDLKWIALGDFWAAHPLLRILCEQPAIWTVPLAIGLMVAVSKLTHAGVPADVRMKMLVLHAPEKLGLKQEYIKEHEAHGH